MNEPIPIALSPAPVTLFQSPVHAGFPAPAADFGQNKIDLNSQLLINANASFLFRIKGDSMTGIGIYEDDVLIVDRSITPRHNNIVLAIVDDEYTVKRLYSSGADIRLVAENPLFAPILFNEGQELRIWGVATYNLHKLTGI